ncbi:hypothetical protein [Falsiroseomonas oryzae]|uniref:hypothetical protein n=1 Tax=Falsiroseomonas oryzae TaxID=2766473 RepID=UPI0022EA8337|nr:hypothetical protein [Roseomonas sp. MO-31]
MTTFMTRHTFGELSLLRDRLIRDGYGVPAGDCAGVAGLFVPWSGAQLASRGGIYWVGAGTEGDYGAAGDQGFEACHERAAHLCDRGQHGSAHTPTWMFLDGLTRGLLGGAYDTTAARWGWSNLLKIGWSAGRPEEWPSALVERQQQACALALREELACLRDTLVFVASLDDFGILGEALGGVPAWHGRDEATGLWWYRDEASGNLVVHGCDPAAARRGQFAEAALDRTLMLAGNLLTRRD